MAKNVVIQNINGDKPREIYEKSPAVTPAEKNERVKFKDHNIPYSTIVKSITSLEKKS